MLGRGPGIRHNLLPRNTVSFAKLERTTDDGNIDSIDYHWKEYPCISIQLNKILVSVNISGCGMREHLYNRSPSSLRPSLAYSLTPSHSPWAVTPAPGVWDTTHFVADDSDFGMMGNGK